MFMLSSRCPSNAARFLNRSLVHPAFHSGAGSEYLVSGGCRFTPSSFTDTLRRKVAETGTQTHFESRGSLAAPAPRIRLRLPK